MPSPRARPLTSCVLPAPRSPESAMTSPRVAARPHASPRASVSAGLCEMFVAMGTQSSHAGFIAKRDAFAFGDLADAGERDFGKLLLPCIEQWHGILAGNGKQ